MAIRATIHEARALRSHVEIHATLTDADSGAVVVEDHYFNVSYAQIKQVARGQSDADIARSIERIIKAAMGGMERERMERPQASRVDDILDLLPGEIEADETDEIQDSRT